MLCAPFLGIGIVRLRFKDAVMAGRLKYLFGQVTVEHSIPGLRMPMMIGLWCQPRGERSTRGQLPRADVEGCLALQEAGGGALEERTLTARKTVSQAIQQFSNFLNFVL